YLRAFPSVNSLGHYLQHRTSGDYDPNPVFDSSYYLKTNPDVARAGGDPLEHFLKQGYREGRDPSPSFDVTYYGRRYLKHDPGANPMIHYLETGRLAGHSTTAD